LYLINKKTDTSAFFHWVAKKQPRQEGFKSLHEIDASLSAEMPFMHTTKQHYW